MNSDRRAPRRGDRRVAAAQVSVNSANRAAAARAAASVWIDRSQVPAHRVPVPARGVAERVADRVQHAGVDHGPWSHHGDRFGQARDGVADPIHTSAPL